MLNEDLYERFMSISQDKSESNSFTVIPILKTNHKLGVSKEGYPKLFICTNDSYSTNPNTMLDILSVEYNLPCTFIDDFDSGILHHYTVVTLRSTDRTLQDDFFDIVMMMIAKMPAIPTKREIAIEVENLISIFSAMSCPPRKKIQGLWAEMLVIEQSYKPEILTNAWHESPTAKFDFTMGQDKIEVKSTSRETRIHRFSLDQLNPSPHSRVVVASVIVRESASSEGGLSVIDLYSKICIKVDSVDTQFHLKKIMSQIAGSDMQHLNDLFFDYVEACDTLRFYDSKDIPRVNKDGVQSGVSDVGFDSDLSGVVDIQSPDSRFERSDSELYGSLFS